MYCSSSNFTKIRFRPRLRPGPRWGSLRRSPDPLVGWGWVTPSPFPSLSTPSRSSRSRRLASQWGPSVVKRVGPTRWLIRLSPACGSRDPGGLYSVIYVVRSVSESKCVKFCVMRRVARTPNSVYVAYRKCFFLNSYIIPDGVDNSDVTLECSDENSVGRRSH